MLHLELTIEGADRVLKAIGEERARMRAALMRTAQALADEMKHEAMKNLNGGVMKRRGTVSDLYSYVSTQPVQQEPDGFSWGLPSGGEAQSAGPGGAKLPMSRIGAFFEKGGTVRPVRAKMLRIPIKDGPALTPAGYDRYGGVQLRTVPGFYLRRGADGKLFLFKREGPGGGGGEPWYVLAHSMTVRPHPWFSKAFETVRANMQRIVDQATRKGAQP